MFRNKPPLAVLVVLLVLAGLIGIPAASATPPDASGVVEREDVPWWWWEFDVKSGLAATFNLLDLGDFCDPANAPDPEFGWTAPPLGIGTLDGQAMYVSPLAETSDPFSGEPLPFHSYIGKLKGEEVATMAWALNEEFFTEFLATLDGLPEGPAGDLGLWEAFCGWWNVYEPMAWGYTKVRFTDNDVIASISDNNRSNAFGFTANGKLTDGEGAQRPFHTVVKIVWSGDIFVEKFHGVFKIGLK